MIEIKRHVGIDRFGNEVVHRCDAIWLIEGERRGIIGYRGLHSGAKVVLNGTYSESVQADIREAITGNYLGDVEIISPPEIDESEEVEYEED